MREQFNFAQRRRMAGLVRRPRSPADLPGNATHAMQTLTFPCSVRSAGARRIALSCMAPMVEWRVSFAQTHPVATSGKRSFAAPRYWGPRTRAAEPCGASTCLGGPRRRAAKRAPAAVTRDRPRGQQSTYDAMGSLIAVSLPDGRLIEYVTDGQGRRIAKKVNQSLRSAGFGAIVCALLVRSTQAAILRRSTSTLPT